MIGTTDTKTLVDFYKELLQKDPDMDDGTYFGWLAGKTFFSIGYHSEVSSKAQDPKRIMLNLESNDVKKEFERIKSIKGVTVIQEPYELQGAWIATFADPDGNYLQLMTPWEDMQSNIKE